MTHGAPPDLLETLRRALAGRYDVDRLLGQGGMGSVFLGRDVVLDRPVAIKVVASELAGSTQIRERFLQEARLVARLRHPGIVAVYTAGESEGLLYFVMELVEGESLRDRIARDGRIPAGEVAVTLRDLARALAYAHEQGVVHRDVKPENVLIDRASGRALLVDFGVARAFSSTGDARVTLTGFVLGSPKYMSPEQASGDREIDGRSDVYSLGLVGYEMLSGAAAVSATTPGAALVAQITQRPESLALRVPDAPATLIEVLERAIEKNPDDRWPTASAFAEALDDVVAGRVPGLEPVARTGATTRATTLATSARTTRRRGAMVAIAAVALAALVGVWAVLNGGDRAPSGVDARKSFLVAPFEVTGNDPQQLAWLREGSVSMLSLNLAQWKDLTVVDYERSLDLLHEAGLDDERRIALEQARSMARRARVWTVVMGRVTGTPDSVIVEARLYDVARGNKIDEAQHAIARTADPRPVYDALARDLLDLAGAPKDLALQKLAQVTTGSIEAYRSYLDGSRALNGWQLARADSQFARATQLDSTFALAYYKRALTAGWKSALAPEQGEYIQKAIDHGARLPAQQREVLDAYRDLTLALRTSNTSDTARANALYLSAQRKYRAIAERDSSFVEAWYGLGDALWHHQPDGWGARRTVANWSASLRAFDRVLALDSTFHLVYSHKLELYRRASANNIPFTLDGDTLVYLGADSLVQRYGVDRIRASRQRAASRAIAEALAWSRTDPVPQAYLTLVGLYAETRKFDSALVVLDTALAKPGGASPRMRYMRAALVASRGAPEGLAEVRKVLREVPVEAIREDGLTGDVMEIMLQAGNAASYGGGVKEVATIAAMLGELYPAIPGTKVTGTLIGRWFELHAQMAMGVPWSQVKAPFDSIVQVLERVTQGEAQNTLGGVGGAGMYIAYLSSGNAKYADQLAAWAPWMADMPELAAMRAIGKGDTATARALSRRFPPPDSIRAANALITPMRWIARAQVLEELGDARAAVANYEVLDPTRFSQMGRIDVTLPLHARSFLARGRLYEQLGEKAKATESYRRFLEMWKDADPSLDVQRQEARAGLARLGDASGKAVPAR